MLFFVRTDSVALVDIGSDRGVCVDAERGRIPGQRCSAELFANTEVAALLPGDHV